MSFVVRDLMIDVYPEAEGPPLAMCLPATGTPGEDEKDEEPECPAPSCGGDTQEPEEETHYHASLAPLAELQSQLRARLHAAGSGQTATGSAQP